MRSTHSVVVVTLIGVVAAVLIAACGFSLSGGARPPARPTPSPAPSPDKQGVSLPRSDVTPPTGAYDVFESWVKPGPAAGARQTINGEELRPRDFTIHWAVDSNTRDKARMGSDPQAGMDFEGLPIRRDWIFYGEAPDFGPDYPEGGPSELASDPKRWARFLATIGPTIASKDPDPNSTKFATIDWEHWPFYWEKGTGPWHERWREWIRRSQPDALRKLDAAGQEAFFASTYNAFVERLITAVLREARAVRPRMKYSFYAYPNPRNGEYLHDPARQPERRMNDEQLGWLWGQLDCICIAVWQAAKIEPKDRIRADSTYQQITAEDNARTLASNIVEGRRVAKGKPVYILIAPTYIEQTRGLGGQPLSPENAHQLVWAPYLAGADGYIIWGYIPNLAYWEQLSATLKRVLFPPLKELVKHHYGPRNQGR